MNADTATPPDAASRDDPEPSGWASRRRQFRSCCGTCAAGGICTCRSSPSGVRVRRDCSSIRHRACRWLFNWTPSLPYRMALMRTANAALQRGDLIVFRSPAKRRSSYRGLRGQPFFQMVRGLPGDVVTVQGRLVYVNGEPVGIAKTHAHDRHPLAPIDAMVIPPALLRARHQPRQLRLRYRSSGLVRADQVRWASWCRCSEGDAHGRYQIRAANHVPKLAAACACALHAVLFALCSFWRPHRPAPRADPANHPSAPQTSLLPTKCPGGTIFGYCGRSPWPLRMARILPGCGPSALYRELNTAIELRLRCRAGRRRSGPDGLIRAAHNQGPIGPPTTRDPGPMPAGRITMKRPLHSPARVRAPGAVRMDRSERRGDLRP